MRYYGLLDFLRSIQTAFSQAIPESHLRNLIDPVAAATVLRSASQVIGPNPTTSEMSRGLHDAMVNALNTRPYKGGRVEVVIGQVCHDLARAYGFNLSLTREQMADLVTKSQTDSLSPHDICRALRGSLRKHRMDSSSKSRLVDCRVHLVHQDVGETPDGTSVVQEVQRLVEGFDADISTSPAIQGSTRLAREGVSSQELGAAEEVLSRTITLVTKSHLVIIIDTTVQPDAAAEREWALRCGIPVIELDSRNDVRPLRDGTKLVYRIPISGESRLGALNRLSGILGDSAWRVQDQRAYAKAMLWKNAALHRHLRVAWDALAPQARRMVVGTTYMSEAYINGVLSHPAALEVASETQLSQWCLLLLAAGRVPFQPQMTQWQRGLLGEDMGREGITDPTLILEIYSRAEQRLTDSERYHRLTSHQDAHQLLISIIEEMEEDR